MYSTVVVRQKMMVLLHGDQYIQNIPVENT